MATSTIGVWRRIPADPADFFDADEVAKAKDYQRPLSVARAISLALNATVFAVLVLTQAPAWFADLVGAEWWLFRLLAIVAGLTVVLAVVDLPVSIWTTFAHEKRWGFSTETPGGFVADLVKGIVLGIVIQSVLFGVLWWLFRTTDLWWVWGWLAFFVFTVGLALILPTVIMPIFNTFTPLEDDELNARIRSIVEGAGMSVSGVQVMDASKRTRKDNAFFAGIGRTRRVVLFDNLLTQPHEVIGSVVAHELGHWRRRHVARSIGLATVITFVVFAALYAVSEWDALLSLAGVDAIGNPEALLLVLAVFVVVSSFTGIVQAWVSRAFERQADIDALELTDDHDAFAETHRGLSTRNLSDLAPSRFKYLRASHPPAAERLMLGKLWLQQRAPADG